MIASSAIRDSTNASSGYDVIDRLNSFCASASDPPSSFSSARRSRYDSSRSSPASMFRPTESGPEVVNSVLNSPTTAWNALTCDDVCSVNVSFTESSSTSTRFASRTSVCQSDRRLSARSKVSRAVEGS